MYIIGLMSGTSLDGLDIALCEFGESSVDTRGPLSISHRLVAAETVPYSDDWLQRLATVETGSAYDYALAHVQLGHYWGRLVNDFRRRHPVAADLIASHGHTIFHQPYRGLTAQIGDGDALAAETGLPVAFNFRSLDVALGGQGAPLVPIGDRLLFGQYEACLNLGGISNISFTDTQSLRIAFDVSPCNMALNYLSHRLGQSFDRDGIHAAEGQIIPELLDRMNALDYYRTAAPKSLGKEWFLDRFQPLLSTHASAGDLLRTTVEHIAQQIALVLNTYKIQTVLATGGGAFNGFLMQRLREQAPNCRITVPSRDIVEYKEALIFALLGYLRITHRTNTLACVTGASRDTIGGNLSGLPF